MGDNREGDNGGRDRVEIRANPDGRDTRQSGAGLERGYARMGRSPARTDARGALLLS